MILYPDNKRAVTEVGQAIPVPCQTHLQDLTQIVHDNEGVQGIASVWHGSEVLNQKRLKISNGDDIHVRDDGSLHIRCIVTQSNHHKRRNSRSVQRFLIPRTVIMFPKHLTVIEHFCRITFPNICLRRQVVQHARHAFQTEVLSFYRHDDVKERNHAILLRYTRINDCYRIGWICTHAQHCMK